MIICPYCGASVDDRAEFCPLCFTTLQADRQHRRRNQPAPYGDQAQAYNGDLQGQYPNQPVQYVGQPQQPAVWQSNPDPYGRPLSYDTPPAPVYAPPPPPAGFDRAYHARDDLARTDPTLAKEQKRARQPLPRWLSISLITSLLLCLAALASVMLMYADLRGMHDKKVQEYRSTVNAHPLPGNYLPIIENYAQQYNLRPAFVAAIILNESSFHETAESRVGARGLMQVMEKTGSWVADRIGITNYSFDKLWDPDTNVRFGCWYLNYLSKMFDGDPVLVTSAYHAGQGNVSVWLRNPDYSDDGIHIELDRIPTSDTKAYATRVMRDYAIYDALYYHAYNGGDTAILDPDADSADPG
ncbi:MAG: transglycosylase SLT domain-containing protein [Clostridia bacterium]|nr:transglycosylase SLT domain-containing protein [Clostridia bacterium]